MRSYELALVLKTSLSEGQKKKLIDTVKGWLKAASDKERDVKVEKEDELGQKLLAYTIKHEKDGYFVLLHLSCESGIPSDFEKKVLTQEGVLRHLLVRKK